MTHYTVATYIVHMAHPVYLITYKTLSVCPLTVRLLVCLRSIVFNTCRINAHICLCSPFFAFSFFLCTWLFIENFLMYIEKRKRKPIKSFREKKKNKTICVIRYR